MISRRLYITLQGFEQANHIKLLVEDDNGFGQGHVLDKSMLFERVQEVVNNKLRFLVTDMLTQINQTKKET